MDPTEADALAQRACGALLRCSVRDTDLPHRACIIMETFWSVRDLVPQIGPAPGAWPERLGAGVTYWCLERFKFGLRAAQSSTDRVNKALDVMRTSPPFPLPPFPPPPPSTFIHPHHPLFSPASRVTGKRNFETDFDGHAEPRFSSNTAAAGPSTAPHANAVATSGAANGPVQAPNQGSTDPFQEVDWSMFMDDFGWVGDDGVLLGLP